MTAADRTDVVYALDSLDADRPGSRVWPAQILKLVKLLKLLKLFKLFNSVCVDIYNELD